MKTAYSLRVFHPDGHYDNARYDSNHLKSNYSEPTRYDFFDVQSDSNPITEVVYWNRIYRMQNGRMPVVPQRIEKWECGKCTVVKFNPAFFKATNLVLEHLPKSIRRYRKNWNYVRLFGM